MSYKGLPHTSCFVFVSRAEIGYNTTAMFVLGASIYDVCTEGGGGVPSKAEIVSNLSKGGCMNLQARGERDKKSEIIWSYMEAPQVPGCSDRGRLDGQTIMKF